MNILMIGLYSPHIGGIATHTYHLKMHLEMMGHRVHVLTYSHKEGTDAADVHMVDTWSRMRGFSFIKNAPKLGSSIIEDNDIEVIHSHFAAPPGYVGNILGKKHGLPNVLTVHGSDINFMSSKIAKRMYVSKALSGASHIICVSKDLAGRVETKTSAPVTYIPNGVDTSEFYPSDDPKEYILYVGALTSNKRVDEIIDALEGTGEKLVIAGDGPEKPRLMWLARQRGVDATFTGYTTEVPSLMHKAKILVQPSKEEGFGLTVLEAMASGVPAIARKLPALEEIVTNEENGLLFPCYKVFKKQLDTLRTDEELQKRLSEAGLRTASEFSWKYVASKTADIYKDVTGA